MISSPAPELQAGDHLPDAFGRAARQRDVVLVARERPRVGATQLRRELAAAFEVVARAALRAARARARPRRRARRPPAAGRRCPRSDMRAWPGRGTPRAGQTTSTAAENILPCPWQAPLRSASSRCGLRPRSGASAPSWRPSCAGPARATTATSATTPSCGSGRWPTSRTSGPTSGSSAACAPPSRTSACSPRARCRARAGSRAPSSTTPRTCCWARCPPPARGAPARGNELAVLHCSELRELDRLSWGELSAQVAAAAGGLRALGVGRGDRVVAYMPNIPETLVAFLASASIGAIWSSAAPEFGARSVIDRFAQIEPKLLLAVDGYRHGGKDFDRTAVLEGILAELPTVEHVVELPYLVPAQPARGAGGRRGARSAWAGTSCSRSAQGQALEFEQVPFDHPLWVLYSSGTTGLPKAIVQGHGGILRGAAEEAHAPGPAPRRPHVLVHHHRLDDVELPRRRPAQRGRDRALRRQPRPPGPGGAVEAGRAHLDHLPGRQRGPARERREGGHRTRAANTTCRRCARSARPARRSRRRASAGSTSTWTPTCGCSPPAAAPTCAPRSSAAARCCPCTRANCRRACSAARWRPGTRRATASIDEVGELVITEPMPSMPLFFWGDEDGERLRESYFSMYPGVWRHGDWIRITPRGGAFIYGRSDSTINRQGVRMGTSEIYRAAATVPAGARRARRRRPPRRAASCGWCCSSCWSPACSSTRSSRPRSSSASARTARRATSPTR